MKTETYIPLDPPGTLLLQEFIEPMCLSQKAVALGAGIPYVRFNELIHGKRRITGEYALRLGYFFQMEAQFWINLQADYDLRKRQTRTRRLEKDRAHRSRTHGWLILLFPDRSFEEYLFETCEK